MRLRPVIYSCLLLMLGGTACRNSSILSPPPPLSRDSVFTILSPFWSKDGAKILFFGHVFGVEGYDLYEVDPAGGVATMLMRDSLAKGWPALSPDGTKIAYVAAVIGRLFCCAHVWVMNRDGTNPRDLTPFGGNWEYLRWSPDSRTLIFDGGVEDSGAVNYQIVRVDIQTGDAKLLTRAQNYGNRDATYLSDGKRIVYHSGRIITEYGGKVWIMSADGKNAVPIDTTSMASTYPWSSPARNELVFAWAVDGQQQEDGTYIVNADSVEFPASPSSFRKILSPGGLSLMQWSPDGNTILYPVGTTSQTMDLFVMNRDGTGVRRLTNDFSVDGPFSDAWSPDSRKIVFKMEDKRYMPVVQRIYIYDFTLNILKELTITRK